MPAPLINLDIATEKRQAWLSAMQKHPVRRLIATYGGDVAAVAIWMVCAWAAVILAGEVQDILWAYEIGRANECVRWGC
jgi:hypothetical protein